MHSCRCSNMHSSLAHIHKLATTHCISIQAVYHRIKRGNHSQPNNNISIESRKTIKSHILYPKKYANNYKKLSTTEKQQYKEDIQKFEKSVINGTFKTITDDFIRKLIPKMPHIHIQPQLLNIRKNTQIIKDDHIQSIDLSGNHPMIEWRNFLHLENNFNTENDRAHEISANSMIRELLKCYHLHCNFSDCTPEAKMIIGRGLNAELSSAYSKLSSIHSTVSDLELHDFHHLVGNLGLNIIGWMDIKLQLNLDSEFKLKLHEQLLCKSKSKHLRSKENLQKYILENSEKNRILSENELHEKYERNDVLFEFLLEYYSLYFCRPEYKHILYENQSFSNLETMPFLFEMKTLVRIGKLLDYINHYHQRLHSSLRINMQLNHEKKYRVFSEKQMENGECEFAIERCTPDIVLSEPVWINGQCVHWFDAKCTKASNCLNDKKRRRQMKRFTDAYGSGSLLAIGTADLSIVGINDVTILDCSRFL